MEKEGRAPAESLFFAAAKNSPSAGKVAVSNQTYQVIQFQPHSIGQQHLTPHALYSESVKFDDCGLLS
jgi:hypothetical protein